MLVLTRTPDDQIRIGEEITLTVIAVNGNQVRLGIEAPKEIAVHRQEIVGSHQIRRLSSQ